jgi:hypothetical protein
MLSIALPSSFHEDLYRSLAASCHQPVTDGRRVGALLLQTNAGPGIRVLPPWSGRLLHPLKLCPLVVAQLLVSPGAAFAVRAPASMFHDQTVSNLAPLCQQIRRRDSLE